MWSELWSDLKYRLRALVRRDRMDQDLDDEVRFHLEREAARQRADGADPATALRRARLAFGGVDRIKEESRDARGIGWAETVFRDLRHALRGLRASPGFSAAVVATLALGIGANAAMFTVLDRLLFRAPAHLRDAGRVHRVYLETRGRNGAQVVSNFEYTRYLDLIRESTTLDGAAAFFQAMMAVGRGESAQEQLVGAMSASAWDFFDAPPALGRYFGPAEDSVPRGSPVAVLSYGYWQARYQGRRDVVGSQLQIGPLEYTIIGVAPKGFAGQRPGSSPVAFIPITSFAWGVDGLGGDAGYYRTYNWGWLEMLVRRRDGVGREALAADLSRAYGRSYELERALDPNLAPASFAAPRVIPAPVQPERGPDASATTRVAQWVSGIALIVLLIACANVANLLLVRGLARRREIGLRLALGVSGRRLMGQLVSESLVLAAVGGAAGLALALAGTRLLSRLFLPEATPVTVDLRTVLFLGAVTVLSGVVTGLVPAWQARREDPVTSLALGPRAGGPRRSRLRDGLLLGQAALSVVLLVGAGLFVRSLDRIRDLRLGYDPDRLVFVNIHLRGQPASDTARAALANRLLEAAEAMPEVASASLTMSVPFWLSRSTELFVEGIDSVRRLGHFSLNAVTPDYFETMGTRLLRGRGITEADRAGAPRVMVVSETMGRTLWPGLDPIGRCIRVEADSLPCTTVVGVAEDIRRISLTDDPGRQYYLSAPQFHPEQASLLVRTRGRAADQAEVVRARLQREMPGATYVTTRPLTEGTEPAFRSWTLGATMFAGFGGLAVFLAGIGLYSVIAFGVAQRRRELGVRMALGATGAALRRLVVGQGIRFALIGVVAGGVVALLGGRWLEPLLYRQHAWDPVVYLSVAGVLAVVAVLATAIPASRAARVDPCAVLRED